MILDQDGFILTNDHVISQNSGDKDREDKPVDRITVSLHGDDTKYKARVIGFDKWTDLAVIKIDAGKPLKAAQLGESDSMRVGDWVLAIGESLRPGFHRYRGDCQRQRGATLKAVPRASSSAFCRRTPPSIPAIVAALW